jgi:hypothetical protein
MDQENRKGQPDRVVFWHRELPPVDAEMVGEHVVEASSTRTVGSLARGDAAWERCYDELMADANKRLVDEVSRLQGDCARVTDETVDPRHDPKTDESWLSGTFKFVLYRRPRPPARSVDSSV